MRVAERRAALRRIAMVTGGLLWAGCRPGRAVPVPTLADISPIVASATAAVPDEMAAPPTAEVGEAAWPSVARGADGILVTAPLSRFYEMRYRSGSERPKLDRELWRLVIEGWVEEPQRLRFSDLLRLPQVEQLRTLECISNPVGGTLIGNTSWRGVRLADVLALAGVRGGARELKMTAADGYQTSIPIELAERPDALLVFEMDGGPLPIKHGYPLRVLLPGRYGQKQPKWLTHLEVITREFLGYWEARGWSNEAGVQINSQIWEPAGLAVVAGERTEVWGIAFADESGVSRVEVSVDGGASWAEAELLPGPNSLVWTEWRYSWRLPVVSAPTTVRLAVRASDGKGKQQRRTAAQSGVLGGTFPDGTSDIHQIAVTVQPS